MSNKVTTLMIFGNSGSGISSTANTILGESKFKVCYGMVSTPEEFRIEEASRQRETIVVIPIHDLKNSGNDQQSTFSETLYDKWKQKDLSAILMIVSRQCRFADDQYDIYKKMKSWVGDDVMLKKLIVVFTACYDDDESGIENWTGKLGKILTDAKNRYVCINNKGSAYKKEMQVCRLLTAVDRLTNPMAPERTLSLCQKGCQSDFEKGQMSLNY